MQLEYCWTLNLIQVILKVFSLSKRNLYNDRYIISHNSSHSCGLKGRSRTKLASNNSTKAVLETHKLDISFTLRRLYKT